jgi:hypothetical protein
MIVDVHRCFPPLALSHISLRRCCQEITWTNPTLLVGGVMLGSRTMEFIGDMKVVDARNQLQVAFKFDGDSKKGGWLGGAVTGASDAIRGQLVGTHTAPPTVISELTGSWVDHVAFNGQRIWDIRANDGYNLIPIPNPLPTDSTFRADLRARARSDASDDAAAAAAPAVVAAANDLVDVAVHVHAPVPDAAMLAAVEELKARLAATAVWAQHPEVAVYCNEVR